MFRYFVGVIVLFVIALIRLSAIGNCFYIIKKDSKWASKRYGLVFLSFIISYLIIHLLYWDDLNFIRTIKKIVVSNYTYQDVKWLPISIAFCNICIYLTTFVTGLLPIKHPGGSNAKTVTMCTFSAHILIIFIFLYISYNGSTGVRITEISSYKEILYKDTEYNEYIEIFNPGALPCDLDEMFLSDDPDDLKKVRIQNGVIGAHKRAVVPLESAELLLSKKEGQVVYLSDANGEIIDKCQTLDTHYGQASGSYGEKLEDWGVVYSSPGDGNTFYVSDIDNAISAPEFSKQSGFYADSFYLTMSCDEGCEIRYTLDGSKPDESSQIYTEPIWVYDRKKCPNVFRSLQRVVPDYENYEYPDNVDKVFIIRAAAFSKEGKHGEERVATFFIDKADYEDDAVISIIADPSELYGDNGIYTTGLEYDDWYLNGREGDAPTPIFTRHGRAYEIRAWIDFVSDKTSISQWTGLRIAGGSSRNQPVKSFALFARKEYSGSDVFDSCFFDGFPSGRIRTKGGYANSIVHKLVSSRDVLAADMERVSVFVNGEFLCNTNIMEQYNGEYIENHYGVDESNVILFEGYDLKSGEKAEASLYKDLVELIRGTDYSIEDNYDELSEIIDIQSYLDQLCIRTYINDMDFTDDKNNCAWKSREADGSEYGDCKWRWGLIDMDGMEFGDADPSDNPYTKENDYRGGSTISSLYIYSSLKANDRFKKDYVNTFMDLTNSIFRFENVEKVMLEYGTDMTAYQGGNAGVRDYSFYADFFRKRPEYVVQYMAEELGLTGTKEKLTIGINDAEMGTVMVNTINADFTGSEWAGDYFTDYSVTLVARPKQGYRFVCWSGDYNSDKNTVEVSIAVGGTEVYATFEKE